MPTAWVNSPSFVNRSTSVMIIMHIAAMNIGVGSGSPGMNLPNQPKLSSLMTGSWLLFIHAAMERPAVKRISVATIGCILK